MLDDLIEKVQIPKDYLI